MGEIMRRVALALLAASVVLAACSALPGSRQASIADWQPVMLASLTPETQSFEIVVRERDCASGQRADGRIERPDVQYGDDTIVVTIRVRPRGGDQTCPSNPLTPFTLELSEPLGDRELLMGTTGEPQPPSTDL